MNVRLALLFLGPRCYSFSGCWSLILEVIYSEELVETKANWQSFIFIKGEKNRLCRMSLDPVKLSNRGKITPYNIGWALHSDCLFLFPTTGITSRSSYQKLARVLGRSSRAGLGKHSARVC